MEAQPVLFTIVVSLCSLASFSAGAEPEPTQPKPTQFRCEVSKGEQANDALRAGVPLNGKFVFRRGGGGFIDRDGALGIKFAWRRLIPGSLIVGGRRLDRDAPPARAYMNDGYGDIGFQATYLLFPTPGCWEITGRIGERSLTFIVQVSQEGNGPDWRYEGLPPGGFWYQTTLESGRTVPSPN